MNAQYCFLLGRNPQLSETELSFFVKKGQRFEIPNTKQSVFLAESFNLTQKRDLPKSPEQMMLDRIGGSPLLAEFVMETELAEAEIFVDLLKKQELRHIGFTVFDEHETLVLEDILGFFKQNHPDIRVENFAKKSMSPAQIFQSKLLKKGCHFLLFSRENKLQIYKTVAVSNLRNYDLRDQKKPFRDAKMGMTPPRLAQILLNLGVENQKNVQILDPFCGSGTICFEAAIFEFISEGSDLSLQNIEGAKKNREFLSQKFRFPEKNISFSVANAFLRNYDNEIIITEGFLGKNFYTKPSKKEMQEQASIVDTLWKKIFHHIKNTAVKKMVLCIPEWENVSLEERIVSYAQKSGFSQKEFGEFGNSFLYFREKTFVKRQIIVFNRP